MNTPSSELFKLIKSLSKGERTYFKRFSHLHAIGEENKYILLFNAIASQNKYDEKKLKEKFRKESFIRQFSVAKNYLYHQLLKALRSYHGSVHSQIRDLLHEVEILIEKGFYKQAHPILWKAKRISKTNELHWALLEIRHWERTIALANLDHQWVDHIIQEENKEVSLLQNSKKYRDLFFQIGIRYNIHGIARNQKYLHAIEKIIGSPDLKDESKARTFEAKLRFYDTHFFYAQTKGDNKGSYDYAKKIIAHFHQYPERIKNNILWFSMYLDQVLVACINMQRYKEYSVYLSELESLLSLTRYPTAKTTILYTLSYHRLNYYGITGQFTDAVEFLSKRKADIDKMGDALNAFQKMMLYGNIMLSYFGAGKFNASIRWLNKMRNETSISIRSDIESFFQLFYIIVHYEAGNYELLPYLIKSAYRFLLKKERAYKFETILIDFFRKDLPQADSRKKVNESFKFLRDRIKPLLEDAYEKNAFEHFDLFSWLESKIENKPFAEVIRQKTGLHTGG